MSNSAMNPENLITCTGGHITARKFWRLFDIDPAYACCPVCGELSDKDAAEIAMPAPSDLIPRGRRSIHVYSLIAKVKMWRVNREATGQRGGCLAEVEQYLQEYAHLLADQPAELDDLQGMQRIVESMSPTRQVVEPSRDHVESLGEVGVSAR